MKIVLIALAVLLAALPCMAELAPSTDQVLNAYIEGCLAQDFKGPIDIESAPLMAGKTALWITVTKDTDDVTLRPFLVYEMAQDLKDIGGKVPNLFAVTCRLKNGSGREIASLNWDLE